MIWILPALIVGLTAALAIPLGQALARLLDRPATGPIEQLVDTGPQDWKRYCLSMLAFNVIAWTIGFAVLALQPVLPLNPDGKGMLAPTTIFNTAASFLTNTNLQHYSGEVHLSYFSQLFAIGWKQFATPAIGLCALLAVIRGLRGDASMGNFYVDLWRGVVHVLLPLSAVVALLLLAGGVPMTLDGAARSAGVEPAALGTDESGQPKVQEIARGPVAAVVAIKQLGTNGGGFFGANSTHPFENPNAFTNVVESVCILLLPFALLVLFGRMLGAFRHALLVGGVMLGFLGAFIAWGIATDTQSPNAAFAGRPALTDAAGKPYSIVALGGDGLHQVKTLDVHAVPPLPVDQSPWGNLEGKELRFGPSAGPTWAALTTCTSNGSVNCMHDSLNPLASLAPLAGMWLNCIFGGVGVGIINMLIYIVVAVFLAGLMVGRTPEYLGKKVEAREMKLASLALLIHPLMILAPTGLFAALPWGQASTNNPGAHGFSEILYEFTSASANNGSGFEGLADTYGFNDAPPLAPFAAQWDIATGLIMLLCRFVPIIAPIALAASLAAKKRVPFTVGTLRTDTPTFAIVLLGTILLVGALLFMPAAVLGPVAAHRGPVPFGG